MRINILLKQQYYNAVSIRDTCLEQCLLLESKITIIYCDYKYDEGYINKFKINRENLIQKIQYCHKNQ